jgi:hypothetical protein
MHIDDTISEFIGALANVAAKNDSDNISPLSKDDFIEILARAKIETPSGSTYENPDKLIAEAREYWADKDRPNVVKNIKERLHF